MISEDDLINDAFELLGELLVLYDNAREEAVKRMVEKTGLTDTIVEEAVNVAFERWMDIYDL